MNSIDWIDGVLSPMLQSCVHSNPLKDLSMSLINTHVQPFKAQAFHNGKFIEVTE